MAFQKKREQKELNLPSLVDVVFLLLIYSLVTIPVERSDSSSQKSKQGTEAQELQLPLVSSKKAVDVDPVLRTFLIQIENTVPDNPKSARMVYILKPSATDSTLGQAMATALRDSAFARFPERFLLMSNAEFAQTRPCRLIRDEIRRFERRHFKGPDVSNRIEIRAAKNTEFRIINFIMRECSSYGDSIPSIAVRTMSNLQ